MNEEDLSKSDLIQMVKHCRKRNAELTVERDEARAELEEIYFDDTAAGEKSIPTKLVEAEARGFERGVKEAVEAGDKMAEKGTYGWVWLRAAILALLEPSLSDLPHKPEISDLPHNPGLPYGEKA
jgi:hypothetical protein